MSATLVSLLLGVPVGSGGFAPYVEAAFAEDAAHVFHGAGVVTALDAAQGTITIDHGDIPGLMEAMEMMYRINPERVPSGLQRGDKIEFAVDGRTYELLDIRKVTAP